jgi:hypothetical protein
MARPGLLDDSFRPLVEGDKAPPHREITPTAEAFSRRTPAPSRQPKQRSGIHPSCEAAIQSVSLPPSWNIACGPGGTSEDGVALPATKQIIVKPDLWDSTAWVYSVARHEAGHAWCVEELGDYTEECAQSWLP